MRAVNEEGIRSAAAAYAAHLAGYLTDALSDPGEHAVAVLLSIALIQHMEMVDVQNNGIHQHIVIMLIIHADIAVEVVGVEQVRQAVALRGLDDAGLFRDLDTAVDACLYDFNRGIRFGNKVDCPDLETVYLCALISSHYDDRYPLELLLFFHHLQNIHTAHLRHLKVEQHQCQIVFMGFDLFQCLDSVRGIFYFIITFEHISQKHLVDILVFDNKYETLIVHELSVFIFREDGLCRHLGILSCDSAHAFEQFLFFIHQSVCTLKRIV